MRQRPARAIRKCWPAHHVHYDGGLAFRSLTVTPSAAASLLRVLSFGMTFPVSITDIVFCFTFAFSLSCLCVHSLCSGNLLRLLPISESTDPRGLRGKRPNLPFPDESGGSSAGCVAP